MKKFIKDVEAAETLKQVLEAINNNFVTENTKIGFLTKKIIINNMTTIIKALKVELRK